MFLRVCEFPAIYILQPIFAPKHDIYDRYVISSICLWLDCSGLSAKDGLGLDSFGLGSENPDSSNDQMRALVKCIYREHY